jgi:hypothetical protein
LTLDTRIPKQGRQLCQGIYPGQGAQVLLAPQPQLEDAMKVEQVCDKLTKVWEWNYIKAGTVYSASIEMKKKTFLYPFVL